MLTIKKTIKMYEIVLINGKDYPVRFGMNALRMFCKDTDRALSDLDKLGESMSLDDACYLILNGIKDGSRVSGQECSLTVESVADLLDEDFDALNKVLEVFSTQFSAKLGNEGNVKAAKKRKAAKK
tara:strand:+ start:377 stop:754 length:378 start_codon:yes stop_codon:yes gene_type:complete